MFVRHGSDGQDRRLDWQGRSQIDGRVAACIWIFSTTVIYNVQNHMEAIKWVCASVRDNHNWISEFSLILQK